MGTSLCHREISGGELREIEFAQFAVVAERDVWEGVLFTGLNGRTKGATLAPSVRIGSNLRNRGAFTTDQG